MEQKIKNINNIFNEGGLDINSVYANFAYTTQHGRQSNLWTVAVKNKRDNQKVV